MRGSTLLDTYRRHGIHGLGLLARFYWERALTKLPGPDRHACPLCGWRGPRFGPFLVMPQYVRRNAACPRCGALERHRAVARWLEDTIAHVATQKGAPLDILHMTPEPPLVARLQRFARRYDQSQYDMAVLPPGMIRVDLCDADLPDASYDVLIGNGILCSVGDLPAALRETERLLRPGGIFLGCELVSMTERTAELPPWTPDQPMRPDGVQRVFGAQDLAALVTSHAPRLTTQVVELNGSERAVLLHRE